MFLRMSKYECVVKYTRLVAKIQMSTRSLAVDHHIHDFVDFIH